MAPRTATIDPAYFAAERAGEFNVIGTAAQRADARGHVTGQTMYFEDVSYPGMTHLKMHRSARDHALIKHVDVAPALAVPGVLRVLTWRGRAEQLVHDPASHRRRAGRRAGAGGRPRPLHGRADLRRRRRDGGGGHRRAPAASVSSTKTCRPSSTSRRRCKPDAPLVNPRHGHNYFTYEGHHCRRIRFGDVDKGFAAGRPHLRAHLPVVADRARAAGDDRLHRQAGRRRPAEDPLRHAGLLLHPRQHGPHPRHPVQPAARGGRHRRRRLWRQSGRHGRADRLHRRPGRAAAGEVRLQPGGGDAGLLAAGGGADHRQGRRDE